MPTTRALIIDIEERRRGNALNLAAKDMDKLAAEVDQTDNKFKRFTEDTKRVNTEIEKSTARIKELHTQLARTGDTSLFGDIRKEEARVRNFQKTLKLLELEVEQSGADAGRGFLNSFAGAFEGAAGTPVLGPLVVGAVAGALISLGPILASELGGVIAGAVGTIGVVGGVLAASQDPKVKGAFADLAEDVKQQFFAAGSSFVEPIRRSVALIEQTFSELDLGTVFGKAAPQLEVIVRGLSDFAKNTMPGLNRALERSGPYAEAAAEGFAQLGRTLSYALDRVTQSKGSLEGLRELFGFISASVVALSDLIHRAGLAFDAFIRLNEKFFRAQAFVYEHLNLKNQAEDARRIADALKHLSDEGVGVPVALEGIGSAADDAAEKADKFAAALKAVNEAASTIIGNAVSLEQANINVAQGFADLNENLIRGKGYWDLNTEAGRKNLGLITSVLTGLEQQREAAIRNGIAAADANKVFTEQAGVLFGVATAAGASAGALQVLNEALAKFIILQKTTSAINTIASVLSSVSFGGHRDAGGPVQPGSYYEWNERGREYFMPTTPGTIVPAGGGQAATLSVNFGGNLDSAFATAFMTLVRQGAITISSKAVLN